VTLLAWCFGSELELELVGGFFRGYASVRALRPEELAALPRGLELACLRFATTRITDYELAPSGLGVHKDYRRWLARLDALEHHLEAILSRGPRTSADSG
jgi:homoserine kinase type II